MPTQISTPLEQMIATCWSVPVLAQAAGVATATIRQLCLDGKLEAVKAGSAWLISDDSARAYVATGPHKPGRPPKDRQRPKQLTLDIHGGKEDAKD